MEGNVRGRRGQIGAIVRFLRHPKKELARRELRKAKKAVLTPRLEEAGKKGFWAYRFHEAVKGHQNPAYGDLRQVHGAEFIKKWKNQGVKEHILSLRGSYIDAPLKISLANRQMEEKAEIVLNFGKLLGKKTVLIEAIHGMPGRKKELDAFSGQVHVPWNTFLVQTVLDHAKNAGYEQIAIVKPPLQRTLKRHFAWVKENQEYLKRHPEAQVQFDAISALYYFPARDLGFTESGLKTRKYWVKEI